jgi:hypothetical protein
MADFSRREACQRFGLMGMAILLGGVATPPIEFLLALDVPPKDGKAGSYPPPLTPEQFEALVGTVKETMAKAVDAQEVAADFMRRFVSFSPRILAAKRPGGMIGSVFIEPTPKAIEMAVNLQMARARGEPAVLDDLGKMAGKHYWRRRHRYFVCTVPNTVQLFGESIHKNRYLLQMAVSSELPPDKIVQTNQDLESLLGRQLTFARLMVNGLPSGNGASVIRRNDIWLDVQEGATIPDKAVSVTLVSDLVRLEMAGSEVRTITPADAGGRPEGWQNVSEAYRNFAVGQMIEAESLVAKYGPRNAFEQTVKANSLSEYRPSLSEIKQRLNWGESHAALYESQKHGRVDLITQQVFFDV